MKNTFVRVLSVLFALVLLLTSLASCGKETADSEYVKKNGKLRVGITDFAPIDYQNEKGEWIGFDADMAKAFAASLGVDVEFIEIDWDTKEIELDNKNIDCIWNGFTISAEREENLDYTIPYMKQVISKSL